MNRTYSELQLHGGKMGNKWHSVGKEDDVDIQSAGGVVCVCVCVCVHRYQLQSFEQHPKVKFIGKTLPSHVNSHQKEKKVWKCSFKPSVVDIFTIRLSEPFNASAIMNFWQGGIKM